MKTLLTLTATLALALLVAVPAVADTSAEPDRPLTPAERCCVGADHVMIIGDWMVCDYTRRSTNRQVTTVKAWRVEGCQDATLPTPRPQDRRQLQ